MGIYMTDKEIRFLWRNRGMNERKTIQCIADLNGCHYGEARDKCEQIGLIPEGAFRKNKSRSNNDLWTADDLSKLVRFRSEGMSYESIAAMLGRTKGSIKGKIQRMQVDGIALS